MAFKEALAEARNSPQSAYLSYITDLEKDKYIGAVFVEDEDDIVFYQHILVKFGPLYYLGCGGKNGVVDVYKHMKARSKSDGNLYIVDRDHEFEPFAHEEVLRTSCYSWEGELCSETVVSGFLQRNCRPNLGAAGCVEVRQKWQDSLSAFSAIVLSHFCLLTLRGGAGLGLGEFRYSDVPEVVDGAIRPSQADITAIEAKVEEAGLSADEILVRDTIWAQLETRPLHSVGHGRAIFTLLRKFVPHFVKHVGVTLSENLSSPKQVLVAVSGDDEQFKYIVNYAQMRLVANEA